MSPHSRLGLRGSEDVPAVAGPRSPSASGAAALSPSHTGKRWGGRRVSAARVLTLLLVVTVILEVSGWADGEQSGHLPHGASRPAANKSAASAATVGQLTAEGPGLGNGSDHPEPEPRGLRASRSGPTRGGWPPPGAALTPGGAPSRSTALSSPSPQTGRLLPLFAFPLYPERVSTCEPVLHLFAVPSRRAATWGRWPCLSPYPPCRD